MKRNITINLFGQLFNIDEDASELLEKYLSNMRAYFSRQEGGEEIADDVERRVAELFADMKAQGKEAITIEDVESIMQRIGNPQQMDEDGAETEENVAEPSVKEEKSKASRRLYRDSEDKMVGGVVSGICHYFGACDPLPWRIAFLLLCIFSYTTAGILYLVLWCILPVANTAEEKLQMRGEPVTPDTLNEEVMRTVNKAKDIVTSNENQTKARGCLASMLMGFVWLVKVLCVFVLSCALLANVIYFLSMLCYLILGDNIMISSMFERDGVQILEQYPEVSYAFMAALILTFFVIVIPLYALLGSFFKKKEQKPTSLGHRVAWLLIWLILFASMTVAYVFFGTTVSNSVDEIYEHPEKSAQTIGADEENRPLQIRKGHREKVLIIDSKKTNGGLGEDEQTNDEDEEPDEPQER